MIYSLKRFSLLDSFENLDEKIVEKRIAEEEARKLRE